MIKMGKNILIGKYTLESLTSGMYLSPLDIYREYVQNSADSIDEAVSKQVISRDEAKINIDIDSERKIIIVSDNGVGIAENNVYGCLVDIGNSKKDYQYTRGFRGIGRLSGLGYCDTLIFETSAKDETTKTIITYNSKLLQELLLPGEEEQASLSDVLNRVISSKTEKEAPERHYFTVRMLGVRNEDGLLDKTKVFDYLTENLPLPFSDQFVWGSMIKEKMKILNITIPEYRIYLGCDGIEEQLFKPYKNTILSDRVRRIEDPIQDIKFKTFYINNNLSGLLWYIEDNYFGTILDTKIKGIRIREGNILFGDQGTLRKCFKEERFNGWLCGELHVVSPYIIPNARRDDFERNSQYLALLEQISTWGADVSKIIREKSYKRNLDEAENKLVDSINAEDRQFACSDKRMENDMSESKLMDLDDSKELANFDLLNSLSILANSNRNLTKYKALNLSSKLTREQKVTYEKIFDLLYEKFSKKTANRVVQTIIDNLV